MLMVIIVSVMIGMAGGAAIEKFSRYNSENELYVKGYLKEEA